MYIRTYIHGTICTAIHVSQRIIYKLVRLIAWCGRPFNLLFGHNWFIYQCGELNYIFCFFGANNADGCLCGAVYVHLNNTFLLTI